MTGTGWGGWAARYGLAVFGFLALVLRFAPGAAAQSSASPDPTPSPAPAGMVTRDSITVVVGHQYAKSGIHEFFFGDNYRTLWDTAVRVPVLDMSATGGGLSVVRRVGGLQTRALAIKGADGRSYTFRGLEKD